MEWICHSENDLGSVAGELLRILEAAGTKTVLFTGDLGAGKTALIRALCAELGVTDEVSSPTFALVNEYRTAGGSPVYHIDLYRLVSVAQAQQIGIEEYLYSGKWVFVEWPDLIRELIGPPYAELQIEIETDSSRRIRILTIASEPSNG